VSTRTGTIAPLVLFDLDGTLVDSAVDLLAAINVMFAREGRPAVSLEALRPVVSKGGRAMLAVAFPDLDAAAREARLLQPFLAVYADAVATHSTPFPGVGEVLSAIESVGARWGIVSNKPYHLAVPVVASMGWATRCAALYGGDSLPRKKPDPDQLLAAAADCGVAPGDCVYVGDDERDIAAARHAGMRSVAALWGYRLDDDNPVAWGADAMADAPLDLVRLDLLRPGRPGP
jgi:phosphoglycolate phosphatase